MSPPQSEDGSYQPIIGRERKLWQNNLFTAIMRCEFMPLPGGTTTNSLLKCDKNSANGSAGHQTAKEDAPGPGISGRDGAWSLGNDFRA